jgi:hypothetical protein
MILSHAYRMSWGFLFLGAFLIGSHFHAHFHLPNYVYFKLEDDSVLINADYCQLFGASDVSGSNGCCS